MHAVVDTQAFHSISHIRLSVVIVKLCMSDDCSQQPATDGAADNFRAGVLSISRGGVRPLRFLSTLGRVTWNRHICTEVAS